MRKKTTKEFITESKIRHGNNYNYDLVYYKNNYTDIKIVCKIHGIFEQTPSNHLHGKGCKKCYYDSKTLTLAEFIDKSISIHGMKYDYSNIIYIDSSSPVKIKCNTHGLFIQTPNNHLAGNNCPTCSLEKTSKEKSMTLYEFISKVNTIHNDKYDYSQVKYKNSKTKINIICPIHGKFSQISGDHMSGKGCSKCVSIISKPEIQIQDFLKNLNIEIQTNKRGIIGRKELDIYIPELKKAIEFNGRYWHYSEKYFIPGKHAQKSNLCREKGIRLLHLREDLWSRDKNKMKEIILKFLKT